MSTRQTRSYSDQERANALAVLKSNGGKISKTARQVDVPRKTLFEWASNAGAVAQRARDGSPAVEKKMDQKIEEIVHDSLDLAKSKLAEGNITYRDLMIGVGIGIEKRLLLKGQPTQITGVVHAVVSRYSPDQIREMLRMKAEFEARIAEGVATVPCLSEPAVGQGELVSASDGETLFDSVEKLEE